MPGSADSAAVRSAHASMIVRTRRAGSSPNDVVWSAEKQITSQRPAAGRDCHSSSPSISAVAGTSPGRVSSAGKRFSKATTS